MCSPKTGQLYILLIDLDQKCVSFFSWILCGQLYAIYIYITYASLLLHISIHHILMLIQTGILFCVCSPKTGQLYILLIDLDRKCVHFGLFFQLDLVWSVICNIYLRYPMPVYFYVFPFTIVLC